MNLRRRRFTVMVIGGAVALCAGLIGARAAGVSILGTSTAAHSPAAEQLTGGLRPAADERTSGGTEASEAPEASETPEATDTPEPSESPEASETPEASENDQGENETEVSVPAHSESPDTERDDDSRGSAGGDGGSPSGGSDG